MNLTAPNEMPRLAEGLIAPRAFISGLLDEEFERMQSADSLSMRSVIPDSLSRLTNETRTLACSLSQQEWRNIIQTEVDPHPIINLLSEDPCTARARIKPRGYAGDAVMLDYYYFTTPPESASERGKAIFFSTTTSPNGKSVFARLRFLAAKIDETARKTHRPNILALACGHLREALLSAAFRDGQIGRFVALEHDEISLAVMQAQYATGGVECASMEIKSILNGKQSFQDFDLVYSAGLFDYLDRKTASKLVTNIFGFIKPGGTLLIGNFLPDTHGRGYMEAFMQWFLITRSEEEIIGLADSLDSAHIASKKYYRDSYETIGYLSITKR